MDTQPGSVLYHEQFICGVKKTVKEEGRQMGTESQIESQMKNQIRHLQEDDIDAVANGIKARRAGRKKMV